MTNENYLAEDQDVNRRPSLRTFSAEKAFLGTHTLPRQRDCCIHFAPNSRYSPLRDTRWRAVAVCFWSHALDVAGIADLHRFVRAMMSLCKPNRLSQLEWV